MILVIYEPALGYRPLYDEVLTLLEEDIARRAV